MSWLGAFGRGTFFWLLAGAASGGALALPALIAVAGVLSARPAGVFAAIRSGGLALLLAAAFAGWALVAVLWSAEPNAPSQAGRLLATVILGLIFASAAAGSPDAQRWTRASCIAAFAVLALILVIEASLAMPLNRAAQPEQADLVALARNPARGGTVLLALFWGAAAALLTRNWPLRLLWATLLLAVMAALAPQFDQLANAVALGFGLAAFALGYAAPRLGLWVVCLGWAIWVLAAPFATPWVSNSGLPLESLPLSWQHRIGIWEYVCQRIPETLWFGHGFDASRSVSDHILVAGARFPAIPLHPHSASLQIWFELGAVGACLAAAALTASGAKLAGALAGRRAVAAAACGAIASLGLIANVSYGLWQEWWIAALLAAAACVGAAATKRGEVG